MRKQPTKPRRKRTRYEGVYKSISGKHEFYYRDSDGKQVWKVFDGSAKEAAAARAEVIAKLGRGETVRASRDTFAELAESWFATKGRLRPKTLGQYRDALDLVLLPRFGGMRIQAINADVAARLVRDLETRGLNAVDKDRPVRPLGYSAVTNYIKPARAIMSFAVRRGLIPANPFDVLTPDERPRREEGAPPYEWSPEGVTALIEASQRLAARKTARQDYSMLLRLTAALGLRLGEVLGLRWEDFDKEESVLHIRRQWLVRGEYGPTKTASSVRRLALSGDLRDALIAHRLRSPFSRDKDPVFASAAGTPLLHRHVARRGFEPARGEAGLPAHLTFHDLRHAAASRLIVQGRLDVVTVAGVLGHGDPSVTLKVYAHLYDRVRRDEEVRQALQAVGA